jgi:hypothetical protein
MIKKVKILNDVVSLGKNRTIYALKGEVLKVTNQRDDVLIVKGKKEIFPIHKSEVLIIE